MKIVIINKSDSKGGAAVVSRRLMEALRQEGEDARILVCEKLTDSPYVEIAASPRQIRWKFLLERLKIFFANGFNRATLFKIDTGEEGLALWKNPLVKEADAILVNWVNQGLLSLNGFDKIVRLGKPVICTMHDMWWMTGICHHAGTCRHFKQECGECIFLGDKAAGNDLSHKVWKIKNKLYAFKNVRLNPVFVPVSHWLMERALESSLLKTQPLKVIPNAFRTIDDSEIRIERNSSGPIRIIMGAARLDDSIKGLDTFKDATVIIREKYPEIADKLEIVLFGDIKLPSSLEGFGIPVDFRGVIIGEEAVAKIYREADIVVSASSYETLPGTLVEAQAYGCIPVSFNRGGQKDIIDPDVTGILEEYSADKKERAENLARGLIKAVKIVENFSELKLFKERMKQNVEEKFSYRKVASEYLKLIKSMQ